MPTTNQQKTLSRLRTTDCRFKDFSHESFRSVDICFIFLFWMHSQYDEIDVSDLFIRNSFHTIIHVFHIRQDLSSGKHLSGCTP